MLVKHDTATSVATDDGEIQPKDGIFDVPVELGERLIRIFGFRPHHGLAPAADAPADGEPAPAPKKPATRKRAAKKTEPEPAADTKPEDGPAAADGEPADAPADGEPTPAE